MTHYCWQSFLSGEQVRSGPGKSAEINGLCSAFAFVSVAVLSLSLSLSLSPTLFFSCKWWNCSGMVTCSGASWEYCVSCTPHGLISSLIPPPILVLLLLLLSPLTPLFFKLVWGMNLVQRDKDRLRQGRSFHLSVDGTSSSEQHSLLVISTSVHFLGAVWKFQQIRSF